MAPCKWVTCMGSIVDQPLRVTQLPDDVRCACNTVLLPLWHSLLANALQRWVRDDRFIGKSLTTVTPLR